MDPIRTPRSNVTLTLPGGTALNDLPAAKGVDSQDRPMFETVWQPDDLERTHIANGAPVILHVWGERHPPVAVRAGVHDGEVNTLTVDHVHRALGYLHGALEQHLTDALRAGDPNAFTDQVVGWPTAPELLELWTEAVVTTWSTETAADASPIEGPPAGDPTDPRDTTAE